MSDLKQEKKTPYRLVELLCFDKSTILITGERAITVSDFSFNF